MKIRCIQLQRAVSVAILVAAIATGVNAAPPVQQRFMQPDSLLAVDQNRSQIVSRLVDDFGNNIAEIQAASPWLGLSKDSLTAQLKALRADQLFAASLANNLNGVLAVIDGASALQASAIQEKQKVLGDSNQDLVYVPIRPCRIVDTRAGYGGMGRRPAGSTIAYDAIAASFAGQGGAATDCSIPANAAAIATSVFMLDTSGPGYITMWANGQTQPYAVTALFNQSAPGASPGAVYYNDGSAIVPLCTTSCAAGKEFQLYINGASAEIAIDVNGYFRPAVLPATKLSPEKWGKVLRNTIGTPTSQFRIGPYGRTGPTPAATQAPLCGIGSLEMLVGGIPPGGTGTDAQKLAFGNETDFAGMALSSITNLKYALFVGMDSLSGVSFPAVAMEVSSPSAPAVGYSQLVYLPNDSVAPSAPATPALGQWQTWDAATSGSKWYATGSGGTATGCTLATPCSFAALKAALPNAVISFSLSITKGRDNAFNGAVDCLEVNANLYDFEAEGVRKTP